MHPAARSRLSKLSSVVDALDYVLVSLCHPRVPQQGVQQNAGGKAAQTASHRRLSEAIEAGTLSPREEGGLDAAAGRGGSEVAAAEQLSVLASHGSTLLDETLQPIMPVVCYFGAQQEHAPRDLGVEIVGRAGSPGGLFVMERGTSEACQPRCNLLREGDRIVAVCISFWCLCLCSCLCSLLWLGEGVC